MEKYNKGLFVSGLMDEKKKRRETLCYRWVWSELNVLLIKVNFMDL